MVASMQLVSSASLKKKTAPTQWIWPGILAAGSITLMTSRWKSGKTTLLSVLLSKLASGGTLAGRTIAPARAVVLTEETENLWEERHGRLNFPAGVHFAFRPFKGRPTIEQWKTFIRELVADGPPGLLVLDPLAMFLPGHVENYATGMIDVLSELHLLTSIGWAIWLLHHPVKGRNEYVLIERCTGALVGFVDIEVKLYRDPDSISPRIRRLQCDSRPYGFGEQFRIELTADGKDYTAVPEEPDFSSYEDGLPVLQAMLGDSRSPMTRMQLWKSWLEDFDRPPLTTLRRWLCRAEQEGIVISGGSGRRRDAFRYTLKERELSAAESDAQETFKEIDEVLKQFKASHGG